VSGRLIASNAVLNDGLADLRVGKRLKGERRLDVLEYLDIAAAIGFDPRELLGALL
jgi:hypothetical protein